MISLSLKLAFVLFLSNVLLHPAAPPRPPSEGGVERCEDTGHSGVFQSGGVTLEEEQPVPGGAPLVAECGGRLASSRPGRRPFLCHRHGIQFHADRTAPSDQPVQPVQPGSGSQI